MASPKTQMLDAISRGQICLHPAGTVPGLGWDVERSELWDRILEMKGRPSSKPVIGLVSSLNKALIFWKPISKHWLKALEVSWPGPLTVIGPSGWDSAINGGDSTLALRVPQFSYQDSWMLEVLEELRVPFPSTSVNKSGEAPALNWTDAVEFARRNQVFVPELDRLPEFASIPSTVIKIIDDTSYQLVRQGAFDATGLVRFNLKKIDLS